MQADYRVKKIYVEDETGDIIADCYDVLYGERFEKYLGNPDDFDARENASNLLQDSNYEISDELRREIESTFGVEEFDDDQDYEGYQFYDFGDDDFEDEDDDEEEMNTIASRLLGRVKKESFNLREALNQIDLNTYNKYDLLNLYESCDLSENEKRALANIVYDQEDPSVIYDTLNNRFLGKEIEIPERVKDGVIHEDDMREGFTYIDTGTNVEVYSDYYIAKSRANKLGLKLAEYGDLDDKYSYCYWNESGNRNDDEQVLAYYKFVDTVPAPLDEFERQLMIDRYEKGPFDNEINESKSIKEETSKESVDEFEFDDEFNAYYDGYTEEDKDKNSAFNKLKDNQINESDVNDYDFVGLNAELRKVMSPDEIDNHSSDLYVKKTAKSTEVLKRFNILGHPLCTTFIDNITHTPWYEVAFAYVPQEFLKDGSEELDESLLQDLQKDHEAIKDTYGQEVYKALDKYLELGFDLGDVLYKESEWNRFIKWAKKNGVSVNTPKSTLAFDDVNESIDEEPYTKEMVEQDLKSITKNFTEKEGELKCGFKEEKDFGVEILKQHYKVVEVSGDDRREGTWYHISFAEPLNKNESVDPSLLDDCPECGDKSFDTKKGKCTKCNYRE